jgi:hypothetical protein
LLPVLHKIHSLEHQSTPLVGQIEAYPVEAAHYRRYQYYTRHIAYSNRVLH